MFNAFDFVQFLVTPKELEFITRKMNHFIKMRFVKKLCFLFLLIKLQVLLLLLSIIIRMLNDFLNQVSIKITMNQHTYNENLFIITVNRLNCLRFIID